MKYVQARLINCGALVIELKKICTIRARKCSIM